jgi:predicted naringenin-chalcone synthase
MPLSALLEKTGMTALAAGMAIEAIGTALPTHALEQSEAAELACAIHRANESQAAQIRVLYRRSGVERRYTCVEHRRAFEWLGPEEDQQTAGRGPTTAERMEFYRREAPRLAAQAARQTLAGSSHKADRITHLVTVSCTGFHAPGVDIHLIDALGLRPTVARTHIGFMGCHGAINGLRVAQAFVAAESQAAVLLCAVELSSLHYHYAFDPLRLVGNAVFADGAAALIGVRGSYEASAWRVVDTASVLMSDSQDAMSWNIGDHGFEMLLAPQVPQLIEGKLQNWLCGWLDRWDLSLEKIGSWAIHPGGPRIVSAVENALGLSKAATAASRNVLRDCGNMSSPTLLFVLQQLMLADVPRPCVMIGFGPGLVAEAALLV